MLRAITVSLAIYGYNNHLAFWWVPAIAAGGPVVSRMCATMIENTFFSVIGHISINVGTACLIASLGLGAWWLL